MPSFFTHKQSANRIIHSKVSTRHLWTRIYSLIHGTCNVFLFSRYLIFMYFWPPTLLEEHVLLIWVATAWASRKENMKKEIEETLKLISCCWWYGSNCRKNDPYLFQNWRLLISSLQYKLDSFSLSVSFSLALAIVLDMYTRFQLLYGYHEKHPPHDGTREQWK